uniref:Mutator-like transposase domain-containing protein n=1 Tax=Magallana gigas TaxID=29159 RepID=A0A8W8JR12_MAGGI
MIELRKTRGTKHSYSREADDCYNTQPADHDVHYDADIAVVKTVADDSDISLGDGRRIVELKHIAGQMFCVKFFHPLHLSHIVDEKISGLGSFLHVQCPSPQCLYINTVTTGKRNEKGVFDINNKVTSGKQSCDRARDKEKNSTESTSMEASSKMHGKRVDLDASVTVIQVGLL